jgi:hypothetical protein
LAVGENLAGKRRVAGWNDEFLESILLKFAEN